MLNQSSLDALSIQEAIRGRIEGSIYLRHLLEAQKLFDDNFIILPHAFKISSICKSPSFNDRNSGRVSQSLVGETFVAPTESLPKMSYNTTLYDEDLIHLEALSFHLINFEFFKTRQKDFVEEERFFITLRCCCKCRL
ncbi:hypothetical protein ACOME3_003761 [Neoechinorhynchus agilis]